MYRKFIKTTLLSLVVLVGAFWSGSALAVTNGQCYAPKPQMRYAATASKVKFNTSQSAFNLHGAHGGVGGLVTGLAFDSLFYEYETLFRIEEVGNGMVCVALDKIKVFYRARPIVFISSEFPRGSCEFDAILIHENKHVRALKKFHKSSAMDFKDSAQNAIDRLRPMGPMLKQEASDAQESMQAHISALLDRKLLEVRHGLSKEQNKIDSPSEYEYVTSKCDDWGELLRLE